MYSPESESLPKPDPKHRLLRYIAFFEVFSPALKSGERLDLTRARNLLTVFNKKYSDWNAAEVALADVFYAGLKLKGIPNSQALSLGFLALDDLKETMSAADAETAFIMEAEIAYIEGVVFGLMPKVDSKAPGGSSVRSLPGNSLHK